MAEPLTPMDRLQEAEAAKAELEVEEAGLRVKQLKKGWLTPRIVLQAVVAGLVGGGLLAAWGMGCLKPLLSAQTELDKIERRNLVAEQSELARDHGQLRINFNELAERLRVSQSARQQDLLRLDASGDDSGDEAQQLRAEIAELEAEISDAQLRALTATCLNRNSCIEYSGSWDLGEAVADCRIFGSDFVAAPSRCERMGAVGACRVTNVQGMTTMQYYYSGACSPLSSGCSISGGDFECYE